DTKFVLENNIDLYYEFDLVTDEAWSFIESRHETFAIQKFFYLKENFNFVEEAPLIALNVILVDEQNKTYPYLVELEDTKQTKKVVDQLYDNFELEIEDVDLYLMDTRIGFDELIRSVSQDNIVYGKSIPETSQFPFKHLKDFEVICLDMNKGKRITSLSPIVEGYCYNCRVQRPLNYKCSCVIASYCSIDCKYSNYLSHKNICPKLSDTYEDVETDLQEWEVKPYNKGKHGLVNIGNSCYLNCLLQILKSVPEIGQEFVSKPLEKFKSSNFLLTFYHIMKKINLFEGDELKPWPLKIALGLHNENYLFYAQNDAAECLDSILNLLDESGNEDAVSISKTFKGSFVTKFSCLNCKHIKTVKKEEQFFIMELALVAEKPKINCEFYAIADPKKPFDLISNKMTAKESEIEFSSIVKTLIPQSDSSKTLLFLLDKERVRNVSDVSDSIYSLLARQKNDIKLQETILLFHQPQIDSVFYLYATFNQIQIYNKQLEMKSKLCYMRPIQVAEESIDKEALEVSSLVVHLEVFLYLWGYLTQIIPSLKEVADLAKVTSDRNLLQLIYSRVMNLPLPKNDSEEKNSSEEIKEGEKEDNLEELVAAKIQPLAAPLYSLKYINRDTNCVNCGKKAEHACSIQFGEKTLPFKEGRVFGLDISIDFPSSSPLLTMLKKITEGERVSTVTQKREMVAGPNFTVNSSIEHYFEPQFIERRCKYCEGNSSTMASKIKQYPNFLVLHLKRFTQRFEKNNYVQVKLEEFVDYDFIMNLEGHEYHLMGIVNHRGNLDQGHYNSFSYNRQTKMWLFYDDAKWEVVDNPNRMKSKENYILVYELVEAAN
ncbi:MAG: hypothetical protein IM572_04025, partial [Chitinophagaceae bacterium]|nr:hypothetical protein [Chitinophagaceae bacterium]